MFSSHEGNLDCCQRIWNGKSQDLMTWLKASFFPELAQVFEKHPDVTQTHNRRLEEIFDILWCIA
jgi:ferritin-like metal-binding protein YciE